MAGVYNILNIGWTAMQTHRLSSQVAGHNVANVSTEGYSRQRADLEARLPWMSWAGPVGTGVDATGIHSLRDNLLERSLLGATADSGFFSGRLAVLQEAQTTLGVGTDDPVGAALQDFFGALSDLAADPAGAVQRNQVLATAERLSETFSRVRSRLVDTQKALDREIAGLTDEIQQRLSEIAALNREVRLVEAAGGQANDLRDRRTLLAREVAERIGVTTFNDDEGNLNLTLAGAGVLVEGDTCARLQAVSDPSNDGLLAPVLVSPSGAQTVLDASASGRLGGLLSARDTEVQSSIQDLDTLAYELVSQLNQVHRAGYGLDGVGGRDLFAALGAVDGAAAAMQLDAAVSGQPDALAAAQDAAALPGDNRNAQALLDLAASSFMGGGSQTPGDFWRASVSALGSGLSDSAREADLHAARLAQLDGMREAVSGVSIDEEMIELAKAQRAFEAAAKVIQTGDELLEVVLSLK